MKRLIALDNDEFTALQELANAQSGYVPSYQTLSFTTGFFFVFEDTEAVEKIVLLGARAGLVSP